MLILKIYGIFAISLLALGLLFILFYSIMAFITQDNVDSWFDSSVIGPLIVIYLTSIAVLLLILMALWAIVVITGLIVII